MNSYCRIAPGTNHTGADCTTYIRYRWSASSTTDDKAHAGSPKRETKREHRLRAGRQSSATNDCGEASRASTAAICTHGTFHCAAPCMCSCRRLVTRCKPRSTALQPRFVLCSTLDYRKSGCTLSLTRLDAGNTVHKESQKFWRLDHKHNLRIMLDTLSKLFLTRVHVCKSS
jgi:hypothetical protein